MTLSPNLLDIIIEKVNNFSKELLYDLEIRGMHNDLIFSRNLKDLPIFLEYKELVKSYEPYKYSNIENNHFIIQNRDIIFFENGKIVFTCAYVNSCYFTGDRKVHYFDLKKMDNNIEYLVLSLTESANTTLFNFLKDRIRCYICHQGFDIKINHGQIIAIDCGLNYGKPRPLNFHYKCLNTVVEGQNFEQ